MTADSLLDRGLASLALVALSPLMALIGTAVRITSPGPVVYTQVRVGQDGRPFRIYKFRTMVEGADRLSANVSPADDPRVTRIGRVLRACYLDELPQLVNIVKGDMRLVGPRPETPEYVALYDASERRVLAVKPGLVGASTLAFMDEARRLAAAPDPAAYYQDVLLHERVRLDLVHVDDRSLTGDVRLVLRQATAILRRRKRVATPTTALRVGAVRTSGDANRSELHHPPIHIRAE